MKISGVEYHIDFISNNSLQFASNVITKCVGWIYYKMLHPLLHKATLLQNALLLQNAAEHGSLILWLSSVVNGRSRSNEPFSQFVVSNGKKFPFLYSFSSIKHSMPGGFIFDCFCNEIFVFIIKSRL